MERFVITEEMIKKARTYLPLEDKQAFANIIAKEAIEPVKISVLQTQADETLAIPQMYEENWLKKKLYLAQYFLTEYLGVKVPDEFTIVEYNRYFQSHPFEQLERLKRSKEIADKIYEILADLNELKKLTEVAIYNEKMIRNDPLTRFLAGITVGSSPEYIKEKLEELKKLTEQLPKAQAEAKEIIENKVEE